MSELRDVASQGGIPIKRTGNPVLAASLLSAIVTALFTRSVTLSLASGIIYAALAGIVSFGLLSLVCLEPVKGPFSHDAKLACKSCSFENLSDSAFCTRCGAALDTRTSPAAGTEHPHESVLSWNDIFVTLALLSSALLIYVVPSLGINLIWADWLAIPTQNYLRLVAAVLLTTFLPGYFLLEALDRRRQLRGLEVALLSCLLSLFFVPFLTVVVSSFGLPPVNFETPLVVSLNFAVFLVFLAARFIVAGDGPWLPVSRSSSTRRLGTGDRERLYRAISLVGVLGMVLAISYRLLPYPPYLVADQWPHHAAGRVYETYGNHVFATMIVPYFGQGRVPWYPQWFHIYLGSLFSVSGAPSVNTYFLINFMNIFGLLALYLLALALFKKEKPIIATVALALALFSGFGWAYDLWLKASGAHSLPIVGPYPAGDVLRRLYQTSISTYDVWLGNTYFGSAHPDLGSELQVMALPAMLMLLTLTSRSDLNGWTRYTLIGLLMSLAFLGHVAEGGMFVAILLLVVIFSGRIAGAWKVALATFAGTGLAGAVGFILPDRFYPSLGAFYASLALSAAAVAVAVVRQRLPTRAVSAFRARPRLAIALAAAGLAAWVGLVLLWLFSGYSAFNIWWDCPRCTTTVPLYMYPVRFGILGLLAIPAVAMLGLVWRDRVRGAALIYGFAAVALVLGRLWMAPELFRLAGIEEFRWNKYLALALTIPTAFLVWKELNRFPARRRPVNLLIAGFLLSIVLSSGFASTILYAEFTTLSYTTAEIPSPDLSNAEAGQRFPGFAVLNSHEVSPEELAAIQYVADHLQSGEVVAVMGGLYWGPNSFTYSKVAFMGGLLQNQTFSLTSLYEVANESETYRTLSSASVRFVYLDQQGLIALREHEPLFEAVTALPVVFANTNVTVYAVTG